MSRNPPRLPPGKIRASARARSGNATAVLQPSGVPEARGPCRASGVHRRGAAVGAWRLSTSAHHQAGRPRDPRHARAAVLPDGGARNAPQPRRHAAFRPLAPARRAGMLSCCHPCTLQPCSTPRQAHEAAVPLALGRGAGSPPGALPLSDSARAVHGGAV